MVSKATYNDVWDGLLEVSRARCFYDNREKTFSRYTFSLRLGLAMAGVGALASLLDSIEIVGPFAGIAITVLVLVDLLWDGTTRLAQLKIVNRDLIELETEYRDIWEKTRNGIISDKEARNKKKDVLERLNKITSNVDVTATQKTLQNVQEIAFKVEEVRYAG